MKHSTTCAHCGADIIDIDTEVTNYHAHSLVICVQHISTTQGSRFYQHQSNQRVHRHNWNFWHCSADHMYSAAPNHINTMEVDLQPPPPGNISNAHYMLEDNMHCAYCDTALVDEAYRLIVTYATPVSHIIHNAVDEEGWCCSLDHAKQHTTDKLAILKSRLWSL